MSAVQEKIHVIIRFRPVNKREKKEEKKGNLNNSSKPIVFQNNDKRGIGAIELCGTKNNEPKRFTFDRILDDNISQEETFTHVAEHVCNDVIAGYNGCIFAYGQTGSGKTWTMFGPEDNETDPYLMGIIPRSVSYILSEIKNDPNILESRINVSFIEIYKEQLRDLLDPFSKKQLAIRLNKRKETRVVNMTQSPVATLPDVLKLINVANGYRTKAETAMNASSSRSHMVMMLTTYTKVKDGSIRAGQANFCDLAGSEKVRKTNAKGNTLKEAQKINLSLTILGQVISSLGGDSKKHVPYRDSKLTHLLKDSLGGNCKTTLIVNATKHIFNREETLVSLRFGSRCKMITNKVKMNKIYGKKELMQIVNELKKANAELKDELSEARHAAKESVSFDPTANELFAKKNESKIGKLKSEKKELEDILDDYKQQIDELHEGHTKLGKINHELTQNNEQLQRELQQSDEKCTASSAEISELKKVIDGMKDENEELILEVKSLNDGQKEQELRLVEMKKDQSFEATKLNEELDKFKNLHKDMTQESGDLVSEINKLKNSAESSQMTVVAQQNQLLRNAKQIHDFEKQLMGKNKVVEQYENESKERQSSLDELRQELSDKNEVIEQMKQDLETMQKQLQSTTKELQSKNGALEEKISRLEFERELQAAANVPLLETEALFSDLKQLSHEASPFMNRQITVDEIVKTATMIDHNDTELMPVIIKEQSILDDASYLEKLENKRISKRNTQFTELQAFRMQNPMIIQEDIELKEDEEETDYIAEKMQIEMDLKEKEDNLNALRLKALPKDAKERMNLLIDIAIAEDDIVVLQNNLEEANKNISTYLSDEDSVAAYQEVVYGNKQPMMRLKMGKSVEFVEKQATKHDTPDAGLDFGETMYSDFAPMEITGELLKELEVKLKKGLKLKHRKKKSGTYKSCFVGKEAVTFMMENGVCSTRHQGVMLGNRLLSTKVIKHITDMHEFRDDKKLYQFVNIEENLNGIYSFVFKHSPLGVTFGNNKKLDKNKKNLYITGIEPHSSAIGKVHLDSKIVRFEDEQVENIGTKQIAKIFTKRYANKIPIKITFRMPVVIDKKKKKRKRFMTK